jgi:fructokinase
VTLAIGIELGGTKVVVAGSASGATLIGRTRIATTTPDTTLTAIRRTVEQIGDGRDITSIGIGAFGPVDIRPGSPTHGTIVRTPKADWSGVDILEAMAGLTSGPIVVDTDVNAAMLGEATYGAGSGGSAAYLTVGTGIGAGLWVDGALVHGANHPEVGHLPMPRFADDTYGGRCPYHGSCLEGMASGPALADRLGAPVESLESDALDAAAQLAGRYVGIGVFALCTVLPVETVIIGGGVAHLPGFHASVRRSAHDAANGYPPVPFAGGGPSIVPPALGDDAGVVGSVELGRSAMGSRSTSG